MNAVRPLSEFFIRMKEAESVPRPENEDWGALIQRISRPEKVNEIDEETYWYFLEVLPPRFQRGTYFAFAEGDEPFRLFWQKGDRFFCRQLTAEETHEFCRLAHVPCPL